MKKLLVLLTVFVGVHTGLFAQFSWSGWGRIGITPVNTAENGGVAHTIPGLDGTPGVRTGLTAVLSTDNIGMKAELNVADELKGGDNIYGWWSPGSIFGWNSGLTLSIGKLDADTLRGNGGVESFAAFGANKSDFGGDHQDAVFTRFRVNPGAVLEFSPVVNAYLGAAIQVGSGSADNGIETFLSLAGAHIAGGYVFPGFGFLRVAFVGGERLFRSGKQSYSGNGVSPYQRVEFAFKGTFIKGLIFDIGGKYYLAYTPDGTSQAPDYPVRIAATLTFSPVENLPVTVLADSAFGEESSGTLGWYCNLEYTGLSYFVLGGAISSQINADGDSPPFGIDAYVRKGLNGGNIKIGFGAKTSGDEQFTVALPIIMEYSF
ncbi:hypothetical protein PilKf_01159 [Pillotina sp. SPG140]|jgi:hypothetical protein